MELEIEQELTLEREGFEARLGIVNGLPSSLDDFRVTLNFSDADGVPVVVSTDAAPNDNGLFYYRVQSGYTVPTSVAAGASQRVAFLLVPAKGAAKSISGGTLYYVGATVRYAVGGVEQTVEIMPDSIQVKPMPDLELQYFLPGDVYGDDPMTDAIEPSAPFYLGVRVINHSPGAVARAVSIQSSQPKIVRNDLGLLIDFRIVGAQVNGAASVPTLLASFGDIMPQRSAIGNWSMICSLSGKFVEFSAAMTHAPEFGGALTSLIPADGVKCRRLVGQVLDDAAGRDQIPDFLACENMEGVIRQVTLHESSNEVESAAVDCFPLGDSIVRLDPSAGGYTLSVAAASAALFVQVASPISENMSVRAIRSDGKLLPAANCWISKSKDAALGWQYYLNLFDTGKAADYTYSLTLAASVQTNRAPTMAVVGGSVFEVAPNSLLSVDVAGQDPDGTIPALSTSRLPEGAHFIDRGNGQGCLTWTPAAGMEGTYSVQFKAFDGALAAFASATINVAAATAKDYSGWAKNFWPSITDLSVIGGNADPDGDGISNLLEYAFGQDPTISDQTLQPWLGSEVIDGKRYLTMMFRRRLAASDLEYKVLASNSLYAPASAWQPQMQLEVIEVEGTPQGYECVMVRDSVATADSASGRYLRLWVSLKGTGGNP